MNAIINNDESLNNHELCGDKNSRDIIRSYSFSLNHNYIEMNL